MSRYVLDACALLALLRNEPGADKVALAQAIATDGELLTADHHEFDIIDGREPIRFQWIR